MPFKSVLMSLFGTLSVEPASNSGYHRYCVRRPGSIAINEAKLPLITLIETAEE